MALDVPWFFLGSELQETAGGYIGCELFFL